MKKILILTGRYLPGYKDGGPVRSIVNLVDAFGDKFEIRIMCMDRDHGDTESYSGILVYDWNEVRGAKVFYVPPGGFAMSLIARLAKEADVVYCCGPYNDYAIKAMLLHRLGIIGTSFVLAPMGSFSPKAYAIKGSKKKLFVAVMKALGLFKNITWSVTSLREEEELKSVIGKNIKTVIAEDLPRTCEVQRNRIKREDESLKVIFLSRISRKKNLDFAIEVLKNVKCDVIFDIYGNIEDEEFFAECRKMLDKLPDNVKWEYKGFVDSEEVPALMAEYDAFLFPTRGENYGHVIAEALAAGCIPVISDQTPWVSLEENNCGYVLSLSDQAAFTETIELLSHKGHDEFENMVKSARKYINIHNRRSVEESGYLKIFS